MKIIQLTAENIKKLVAVEINPAADAALVQITGKNGQGKTSVLDAIWWAIAGARNIQTVPIRRGCEQASIRLDMGEIIVKRTFKLLKVPEGGKTFTTQLEVAGNLKGKTPQDVLNGLIDSLAFDPLKFRNMEPKEQFDELKKFVPDFDFDDIATQNSLDTQNRKEANKRAKEARILADQIVLPTNAPTELIDEEALRKIATAAVQHNADISVELQRRSFKRESAGKAKDQAEHLRARAREMMSEADEVEKEAAATIEALDKLGELLPTIDVAAAEAKIQAARSHNELVRRRLKKMEHQNYATALEDSAAEMTERMASRERQKVAAIAAAKLPIESITLGDGCVLLNGVPFDQASDAEQLKASCALAMAGNPTLKVIRVRDGSLLDEEGLALLGTMAEERGFQVWIERVGTGDVGFILEDGMLVERVEMLVERDEVVLPEGSQGALIL